MVFVLLHIAPRWGPVILPRAGEKVMFSDLSRISNLQAHVVPHAMPIDCPCLLHEVAGFVIG